VSFAYTSATLGDGELNLLSSSQVVFRGGLLPRVWVHDSHVAFSHTIVRPSGYFGMGLTLTSGSATLDGGTVTGPMDPTMIDPHLAMRVDGGELTATGGATIACLPHSPTSNRPRSKRTAASCGSTRR
jgi:hypothetical protein